MAQPLYRQLLHQARRLARFDPRRPQQGNLRRAVSSGYYALFHFLIDQSSRFLIGSTGPRERLRKAMSRAFIHSEMANAAKTFSGGNLPAALRKRLDPMPIPPALMNLAMTFVEAQDRRHLADYDLSESFVRNEVLTFIGSIELAIDDWRTLRTDPAARFFLISLLVWNRIKER